MLYTAAEIILFLLASAVIGVLIGYFTWARRSGASSEETETLRRQLVATRKRAAAAEADLAGREEALEKAQKQIEELSRPSTPSVDDAPAE